MMLLAIALVLTGCTPHQSDQAPLDPSVAEPCDIVPETPPRGSSFGTVYEFGTNMVLLYGECAIRDRGKYEWIKSQGH